MIKKRCFPESNYKSIYFNGKTLRMKIDPRKEITELEYPEFYDIKLTGKCAGNCPYCYQDSTYKTHHYENVVEKIESFFGKLTENQKPFQVAIGGGEPTLHPNFIEVLQKLNELGIAPNYTTNGMFIKTPLAYSIIKATKKYSEAVAISCHAHLKDYWQGAALAMTTEGIKVNFHNIISDKKSVDEFLSIYHQWKHKIAFFVLLPHMAKGRGQQVELAWEYLFQELNKLEDISQIAFGANFYPYLKQTKNNFNVSLYEPEVLSKFLNLDNMQIYGSSFHPEA